MKVVKRLFHVVTFASLKETGQWFVTPPSAKVSLRVAARRSRSDPLALLAMACYHADQSKAEKNSDKPLPHLHLQDSSFEGFGAESILLNPAIRN